MDILTAAEKFGPSFAIMFLGIGFFGRFLLAYQGQMTIRERARANEENADADTQRAISALATKSSEKAFELGDLLRESMRQLGDIQVRFARLEDEFKALSIENERKDRKIDEMVARVKTLSDTVEILKRQLEEKELIERTLITERDQLLNRVTELERQVELLTQELNILRPEKEHL